MYSGSERRPSTVAFSAPARGAHADDRRVLPRQPSAWPRLLALGHPGRVLVSLFSTLFALALLAAEAPAWPAIVVFAAYIPWNLVLLVGVWRSAEQGGVSREIAHGDRLLILAWQ